MRVCGGMGVWGEGTKGGVNTERKREFLANAHNYVRAGFKVNWQNCQRIKKCKICKSGRNFKNRLRTERVLRGLKSETRSSRNK